VFVCFTVDVAMFFDIDTVLLMFRQYVLPLSSWSNTLCTLKMDAACFSGALAAIYQATVCNISEGYNLHMHECENHKFHVVVIY
jgi:hypothetical protein